MARYRPAAGGFTLIELMIVVAVLSVLMIIALPFYMEYTTRAKVSEGLNFIAAAKTSVVNSFYTNNSMPTDNAAAGLGAPNSYATNIIASMSVGTTPSPGSITLSFGLPQFGTDNKLQLVPTVRGDVVIWKCQSPVTDGLKGNYIPASCR